MSRRSIDTPRVTLSAQLHVRGCVLAVVFVSVAGWSCASSEPPPNGAPTLLAVDLPAGVQVTISGQGEARTTEFAPVELDPGRYEVSAKLGAFVAATQVDVVAHETTRVTLDSFPTMQAASFTPKARNLAEAPLVVDVFLDGVKFGTVGFGETLAVPAGVFRMRMAATGLPLGGFIEDIDFRTAEAHTRAVVLAPGPDMVRIRGGRFMYGVPWSIRPTEEEMLESEYGVDENEDAEVTIETFDIDRHEVTAADFFACRTDGMRYATDDLYGCDSVEECERRGPCAERYGTSRRGGADYQFCNLDATFPGAGVSYRRMMAGRERHPINCVTFQEAETYCKWVGKRLLDSFEFTYAARSRRSDYVTPCGMAEGRCYNGEDHPHQRGDATHRVCDGPYSESEQGVCDLMQNVEEWLRIAPGYSTENWEYDDVEGLAVAGVGSWKSPDVAVFQTLPNAVRKENALAYLGFRCGRSVDAGSLDEVVK